MSAVDYWQRPGPTARQRHADLLIGLAVVDAALLNVVLLRSVGVFVFGVRRGVGEMLIWAAAVTVPLIWHRAKGRGRGASRTPDRRPGARAAR